MSHCTKYRPINRFMFSVLLINNVPYVCSVTHKYVLVLSEHLMLKSD